VRFVQATDRAEEGTVGKIRLRHGDNEIEAEGSEQFIKQHIERFYERLGFGPTGPAGLIKQRLLEKPAQATQGKAPTPAEFYKAKGKTDGVSKVLIFGKYLEQYENLSDFTPKDINRVAKDAKLSKDIHPQYFTNAVRQGLLRKQGEKYSLALSAEEALAAMNK